MVSCLGNHSYNAVKGHIQRSLHHFVIGYYSKLYPCLIYLHHTLTAYFCYIAMAIPCIHIMQWLTVWMLILCNNIKHLHVIVRQYWVTLAHNRIPSIWKPSANLYNLNRGMSWMPNYIITLVTWVNSLNIWQSLFWSMWNTRMNTTLKIGRMFLKFGAMISKCLRFF